MPGFPDCKKDAGYEYYGVHVDRVPQYQKEGWQIAPDYEAMHDADPFHFDVWPMRRALLKPVSRVELKKKTVEANKREEAAHPVG